jgi:hypothetical protein
MRFLYNFRNSFTLNKHNMRLLKIFITQPVYVIATDRLIYYLFNNVQFIVSYYARYP